MPEIVPFRGLRYNTTRFGNDLSKLIAPPYDVLDQKDKDALLAKSDRNIVAVDLPFVPPKTAGPDEVYTKAAKTLSTWREDGTMALDRESAMYVYHQTYTWAGRQYTRKEFFARMRLEAFGAGKVFPHEQTFGGPKEDRLKLMQATRSQLSAVFGLYSDPAEGVSGLLNVEKREPDVVAEMEGVSHRMWVIADAQPTLAVSALLREKPIYIADGHHRYGTALIYKDWLTANTGPLAADHPANFVLVGFCAMEDAGAIILPTHRVLIDLPSSKAVLDTLGKGVKLTKSSDRDADRVFAAGADLVIYDASEDFLYSATFTQRAILDKVASEHSPAWRKLDLAYLHRYLLDELVTKEANQGTPPSIHYIKSADDAITDAKVNKGIAILVKPCTMRELRDVSDAGDLMPQKSTYFYPKLATGLVVNPLE